MLYIAQRGLKTVLMVVVMRPEHELITSCMKNPDDIDCILLATMVDTFEFRLRAYREQPNTPMHRRRPLQVALRRMNL